MITSIVVILVSSCLLMSVAHRCGLHLLLV